MQAEIRVGDTAQVARRYTTGDLAGLSALAGVPAVSFDHVPEPLVGALFSYLLGVELPGRGTNYLKQEITFIHPVPIGEEVRATVTVTRLRPDKHLCDLATVLTGADGRRLAEGRALVLVRDVGAAAHG